MKIQSLLVASLLISGLAFTSCRETEKKETVIVKEEVEVKTETEPEREGILERTAKKVDAEVNKEIDEKIEKIGDDN